MTTTGYIIAVSLLLGSAVKCVKEQCDLQLSVSIKNFDVFPNGSAVDLDTGNLNPQAAYWKNGIGGANDLLACPCKLDKPCLRKCCAENQAMNNDTLECIPHKEPGPWFRPNVTQDISYSWRTADYSHFGLIFRNICFGYLLEPDIYPDEDKFYINFTDGTLSIPDKDKFSLGPSKFCLDYLPAIDSYLPYVCLDIPPGAGQVDACTDVRYIIYPIGMAVSIVFLIISLVIYATTSELRNLHGKCLMCHIASLLVAYLFLAIVQGTGEVLTPAECVGFGFVIYFALLCTFFWLNIMCIDIYITFSSFRPFTVNRSDLKKFLTYMSYAWGVPIIIISVTAVMELHPDIPDTFEKPKFRETCWFRDFSSRLVYFVVPVGVIVVCNVVLFAVTSFNIYKVKRETSILGRGENTGRNDDKHRLKLYVKLFIVMGVSWILEILSTVIGGSSCTWLVTDMMNVLQGVFIFLIFVCKKNVKELMEKRLRKLWTIIASNSRASVEPEGSSTSGARSASTASTNVPSVQLKAVFVKKPDEKASLEKKETATEGMEG